MTIFLLLLVLIIFLYHGIKSMCKPRKYPPGPKWYPFVGCGNLVKEMTKLQGSQWKGLSKLAKIYSTKILGLKLGSELVVVVYSNENIKHVFTGKEFEGRPDNFFVRLRCLGKRMGITFADGPMWREQRSFTVKHLRNVGFGKTIMEEEIQAEMQSTISYIRKRCGTPFSPTNMFSLAVMNILWKYVAGEHIPEERLKYLIQVLQERSKVFAMTGGWLNQWAWCRFLFPELTGYSLINKVNKQISDIIEEAIMKHKQKAIEGKDFIYSYLEEMKYNENYKEEQLKVICLDLIIAGAQTTSNVLEFAMLIVLRNQAIQNKIFDEIKTVLGDKIPNWSDSNRLVYTSAFLLEIQRCYTITPLAGPRRVLADTYINGYFIPKETTILISIGDVHTDPEIWKDSEKFYPERFIDENGALKNSELLYHFGLGRRRCPGESLAKSFIFIVFVGIIQNFKIQSSNGVLPSDKPSIGLIAKPTPYIANFVARH